MPVVCNESHPCTGAALAKGFAWDREDALTRIFTPAAPKTLTVPGQWPHSKSPMGDRRYFDPLPEEETAPRRGRKKRATAHRIFTSAIDLMRKDGFDGVSVEQICERAGIARATFFQHFRSKAALMGVFSDIVRHRIAEELSDNGMSPIQQLRQIADHMQKLSDELGAVAPQMLSAFSVEPGVGFRVEDPETGVAQLVVGIVEKGQEDGVFSSDWCARDVAISLVASWVAIARHRAANPAANQGQHLHDTLDLHLRGLVTRPASSES